MNPDVLLSRIRIVLCRPSHPGNIGAAARAMKTMGLSDLRLVNPARFPDPEADTRATGAVDVLAAAGVHADVPTALAGCVFSVALSARQRDLEPPRQGLRETVADALTRAGAGPVALVFGNETTGLRNDELMHCQATVSIPTNPAFSSLNLGSAVQLLCHEMRMAAYADHAPTFGHVATSFASPPATAEAIEGFLAHLQRVATGTGFLNPAQPGRIMAKLRRLFGRAGLEQDEVNILRGILASVETPTAHGRRDGH